MVVQVRKGSDLTRGGYKGDGDKWARMSYSLDVTHGELSIKV